MLKAAGVTFAISMLERVIEERARGNPSSAEAIRKEVVRLVGDDLSKLKPGSTEAMRLKQVLVEVITDKSEKEHRLEVINGGTIDCWSMDTGDPARGRKYGQVVAPALGLTQVEARMAVRKGRGIFLENLAEQRQGRVVSRKGIRNLSGFLLLGADAQVIVGQVQLDLRVAGLGHMHLFR